MYWAGELHTGVELPKNGKTRLTYYSKVKVINGSMARQIYDENGKQMLLPPLEIELGDIFKCYFCNGYGGFLVNQIYKNTRNQITVKGCRWYGINSPESKRSWAHNKLLQEAPLLQWELLPYTSEYKLNNFQDGLTEETSLYLQENL